MAVITGATSGIGRGIARVFAREGADVAIVGRDRDAGEVLEDELKSERGSAAFLACDVGAADEVRHLAQEAKARFGKVTCLVNCAGIGVYKPIVETDLEGMDQILSVNFRGYMLTTRHFVPLIRAAGGGSIVNIRRCIPVQQWRGLASAKHPVSVTAERNRTWHRTRSSRSGSSTRVPRSKPLNCASS